MFINVKAAEFNSSIWMFIIQLDLMAHTPPTTTIFRKTVDVIWPTTQTLEFGEGPSALENS